VSVTGPQRCFDGRRDEQPGSGAPSADSENLDGSGRAVCCRACGHAVAAESAVTEVAGKADHAFFNPEGLLFEIRCFDSAPGCLVGGEPSFEFTWFPGHAWRYALCGACGMHLGWWFEGGEGAFFGLIRTRLIDES
jgi:hypothetical protein